MTTRPTVPVRLYGAVSSSSPGVTRTMEAAWALLAGAGRTVRVRDPHLAEVVHTVGAVRPPLPLGERTSRARSVHTVDRIPVRADGITPERRWLADQRRATPPTAGWLVHGPTAARVVVGSGLARGVGVTCLPLLEPARAPGVAPAALSGPARSALRNRLGLAPGVRLVVDAPIRGGRERGEAERWGENLRARGRGDVAVGHLRPNAAGGSTTCLDLSPSGPVVPVEIRDVLALADVFVAADDALTVCSTATVAASSGTPIVATTTDSAVDLVTPGRNGCVVPPRAELVVDAVLAQIDSGRCVRGRPRVAAPTTPELVCARLLLEVYLRVRYGRLGVVA